MVDCKECGESIPEGKNFCPNCGEKIIRVKGEIEYEEYHLRKNRHTARSVLYFGIIFMSISLLFPLLLPVTIPVSAGDGSGTYYYQVMTWNVVSASVSIIAVFVIVLGALWMMHIDWHMGKRLTSQFEEGRRK
ncbi:MAG: zinc-ribbon domain-containing protein [Candidatus Thermoplasmatota archaeon]|nr:zinc-ribbon domain-containing protein [Candidatus Thermoplasmatota archaeon]